MSRELLRTLPKIDELLKLSECNILINEFNRSFVIDELRKVINFYRKGILEDKVKKVPSLIECINVCRENLINNNELNLKPVINATGVVLHTNLGRALLSEDSVENLLKIARGYNNLEYNLVKGERGSRYSHIEDLIIKITGAESALIVNNNAAAIMLVLNSLCENKEVIVSRGQLVEIGGSFRIPEVMNFSKAKIIEVGTTNRTHNYDYENAINDDTGAILKVHSSNFKILGFTSEVDIETLCEIGKKNNTLIIEDIGSGVLIDLEKYGLEKEPTVLNSIKAGADIVTFSGDKMLGGPQAGIIVGKKVYIDKIKKNHLTRALRIDKFTLAALESTFKHYLNEEEAIEKVPTLKMMTANKNELKLKCEELMVILKGLSSIYNIKVEEGVSTVGGGAMPESELPTYLIKINSNKISSDKLEKALRANKVPIICRIIRNNICIDVRTLLKEDYIEIYEALKKIGENI
ncbi:L-seryl-tRNA(Sec) selenium transferase [Clostridium tarantellae]|uniref:L-seryl-tRNA(Sec) selenium transferase n=1 Tax=Clostridium tarantellae TaxID=39493 RepID=A0A6I1MMU2_9CLOT|nr:L-seryl-tRNA(Sec) selenium transferase [Clostridium tarantellae]MPQ44344.1 L-seryl-tRNA(Sec) selenium transferase [Clostridium tarantellae]